MRRTLMLLASLPMLITAAPADAGATVSVSLAGTIQLIEPDGAAFVAAVCAAHSDGTNIAAVDVWCEVDGDRRWQGAPGNVVVRGWDGATVLPTDLCVFARATTRSLVRIEASRCVTLTADCPNFVVVDNGTLHCPEVEVS